jgi:hypothetical protein
MKGEDFSLVEKIQPSESIPILTLSTFREFLYQSFVCVERMICEISFMSLMHYYMYRK